jgi:DNA-binding XRE family transcriptional regulator
MKEVRGSAEDCEMSQSEVAQILFLKQQTISGIEKRATEKFKQIFEEKGYLIQDLL